MKETELRIGNLVYSPFHEENVKILGNFLDEGQRRCFQTNVDLSKQSIKQFQPILLIEEWLVKFKFEKIRKIKFKLILNESLELNLFLLKDSIEIHIYDINKNVIIYLREIKHVHQLQNLYFELTSKELTYETL